MTPSMRKKLLIGGGSVVGLVVIALVVGPSFVDVNAYKPMIVSEVKAATGRDLVLDGPISLSLLPTPTVSVANVKFANVPGSKNPSMVEMKSVTVKPSILGLLAGRIDVSEVTLLEPKIVLEINAEGKPNWEFTPSVAEAKPVAPKPSSPKPLSLGRLTIENGTLIFSDSKAGLSVVAEKANFSASVAALDGPYALAGSADINGSPLKLDLAVGSKGSDGTMPRSPCRPAAASSRSGGRSASLGRRRASPAPPRWRLIPSPRSWAPWSSSAASRNRHCRRCLPEASSSTARSRPRKLPLRPGISR